MYWDTEINGLVVMWRESKTLKRYPTVLIPHAFEYSVCPLFAMANYGIHGGFERDHAHGADPMAKANNMLFGGLSELKNIAAKISNMLPVGAGSKSGRRAAATAMDMHPVLDHGALMRRGGWKYGDHSREYIQPTASGTVLGGKALSEWVNPRERVYYPSLPIEVHDRLFLYMVQLFHLTIPAMKPDGELLPLMKHLVTSLMMAYGGMREDGFDIYTCPTVKALVHAVEVVEKVEALEAMQKLKKWSASIRAEFNTMNAAAAGNSPGTTRRSWACSGPSSRAWQASPKSLKPRDNTSSKSAAPGYSKQPLLQEVLERLAKENKIRKVTMGVDVYDLTNDSAVTKRVFKFTKLCIADEHWDVLLTPKEETEEGRNALKSACEQIQRAVNEQLNKHVPQGNRMQHTVAGISNRIKKHPGGEVAC
ncbi:hypothetical protein TeGR_g6055 [Tetraparma gracilis]|uniref:Uncharacterized protein n=1 Tax=Tetraparma gracilis TaxID=2962635 RepID=A0ABQ6N702_9STRA|nr:hypothetical protein TeGR_g6055 [Tetraparma gracilis]